MAFHLAISGIHSGSKHILHIFLRSIEHIFGLSIWHSCGHSFWHSSYLRCPPRDETGGWRSAHWNLALVVEARWCPLRSGTCGGGEEERTRTSQRANTFRIYEYLFGNFVFNNMSPFPSWLRTGSVSKEWLWCAGTRASCLKRLCSSKMFCARAWKYKMAKISVKGFEGHEGQETHVQNRRVQSVIRTSPNSKNIIPV